MAQQEEAQRSNMDSYKELKSMMKRKADKDKDKAVVSPATQSTSTNQKRQK